MAYWWVVIFMPLRMTLWYIVITFASLVSPWKVRSVLLA
jgi:hypothetical protein